MLRFRSLASGSSGNATLLEASDGLRRTRVLIDCGLGLRQLTARLAADGLTLADLDGVFITHEHGDHLGCASNLMRRHGVPVWTSAGTAQSLATPGTDAADAPQPRLVRDGQVFSIGGIEFHPFAVPHDAREPLQLRRHTPARNPMSYHVQESGRRGQAPCSCIIWAKTLCPRPSLSGSCARGR